MNQNLDQPINGVQPPKKDNTLKIVLIIIGAIFGIAVIGIIGFFFLIYVIFNKTIETYNEAKDDIFENYNSSSNGNDNDKVEEEYNEEEQETIEEYSNIKKITLDELKNLIDKKASFVIVISQTYCGHCIDYKPTFNTVLKENDITGYELDLLTLKKSEYAEFNELLEVEGTPTTFIYIDGVVQKEFVEGNATTDEVNSYLKKYGFIK